MVIRALVKLFYGFFAAFFLVPGISVLLLDTGFLPATVRSFIVELGQGNLDALHVMQEIGCLLVFIGLITIWFILNYEQSRPFHWVMTMFWGLIALVHWFDVRGSDSLGGNIINTIPFALFVAIGLLRHRLESRLALPTR